MARTVAEIDGDSSGLVGALDKGRDGMAKMEASGKKLSDQLREVTDKADQAAGAIVEKIGGPKAIAALGGAGIALGGAKMAADFFLNSVEKLFKSMGDEGMKVWDDVEKSLDAISGAFAKAVLGGGSAEEMGKKLIVVFDGLAKIVDVLVTYGFPMLKVAFDALYWVMEKLGQITAADTEKFDALKRAQDNYASAASVTNVENLTKAYTDLSTSLQGLIGDETALAMSANDRAQAEMQALKASFIKVGDIIRDTEIRKEVEKHRAGIEAQAAAEVANLDLTAYGMGWKMVAEREMADRVATKTGELYSSIAKRFAESGKNAYSFMPQALQEAYDSAEADLSLLWEKANELYDRYLGKEPTAPKTGGGGAPKAAAPGPVIGEFEAKEKAARDARYAEYYKEQEDYEKAYSQMEAKFGPWMEKMGLAPVSILDNWTELAKGVGEVYQGVLDAVGLGTEKLTETSEQAKDQHSELYDTYISQNAKMVAVGIASGKSMAEVGQAAVGAVIEALGAEAFARASIETFKGNFAGAAGFTAAGMAAYATAAALGASGKKASTATAATAATTAAVTNNQTNFNLRVDAAFADEESIARSFARAQSLASNRYMAAGYQ
jgi:hypothetical protein